MSMETADTVVSATDIHREFRTTTGRLEVLKGVTLEVEKGQMAAVTGASGVGKSTLLHILGGLDQPTRGEVRIARESFAGKSQKDLARFRNRKVGFVFQFHYLLEDFTALENVMIPMILASHRRDHARRQGELLLEQVGLSNRQSHRPNELSGGEQQRVAVARALANDPEIVLADEPSGNLDTATGRKLHELLFKLKSDRSVSFVIATHNRELATSCDREFQLVDGRLTGE
jgi:ABC-type lipoprotein export system ATPase subunit